MTATFGVLYSLAASQLIVAHMCKEPVPVPWAALAILVFGFANEA